jgi:hypothetical protein
VKVKSDVRIRGVFLKVGETLEHIDPVSAVERLDTLKTLIFAANDLSQHLTQTNSASLPSRSLAEGRVSFERSQAASIDHCNAFASIAIARTLNESEWK